MQTLCAANQRRVGSNCIPPTSQSAPTDPSNSNSAWTNQASNNPWALRPPSGSSGALPQTQNQFGSTANQRVVEHSIAFISASELAAALTGAVQVEAAVNPKAAQGLVYIVRDGARIIYVGITDNFSARQAAHRAKGWTLEVVEGLAMLSRSEMRGVEQALIERYGLGKNSGTLLNRINSIGQTNPRYAELLNQGKSLLRRVGWHGF